jgi:Lon protease-like protein
MTAPPPDEIPIFPLSTVVLYPTTSVPLYIFEPRYRAMIEDALEGHERIGMMTVDPESVLEMEGDPPIYPVGCEGRIIQSDHNPDGTYSIVLAATRRIRIVEEAPRPSERLYRVARVEGFEESDSAPASAELPELRTRVIEALNALLSRVASNETGTPARAEFEGIDDRHLANALSQGLSFATVEKQQLLEAPTTRERYELLTNLIRFRLAEIDYSGGSDSGVVQ